jgi:hypothetical protein
VQSAQASSGPPARPTQASRRAARIASATSVVAR